MAKRRASEASEKRKRFKKKPLEGYFGCDMLQTAFGLRKPGEFPIPQNREGIFQEAKIRCALWFVGLPERIKKGSAKLEAKGDLGLLKTVFYHFFSGGNSGMKEVLALERGNRWMTQS